MNDKYKCVILGSTLQSHNYYQRMENQNTKPSKEGQDQQEDQNMESSKDSQDQQVDNSTSQANYEWVVKKTHHGVTPLSLSYDIDECVHDVAEQVLQSHVHMALGAVLFTMKPIILWIDCDQELVKGHELTTKHSTPRLMYSGILKARDYYHLENGSHRFGLSRAMQVFRFLAEEEIHHFGLELHVSRFPFVEENTRDVRYLILNPQKVSQNPWRSNLIQWLAMEEEDLSTTDAANREAIMNKPYPLEFMQPGIPTKPGACRDII